MSSNIRSDLYLIGMEVQNFQGLELYKVDANGRHVLIGGPNGSGKSSLANALFLALAGTAGERGKIAEPIHNGAEEAVVTINLGEFIVERKWNKAGPKVTVRSRDGRNIRNPSDLLKGLWSEYSLDPVAFTELREQEQIDQIMSLLTVPPPVESVKQITGEDWPARPDERADEYLLRLIADEKSGAALGEIYVLRREAGRRVAETEAQLDDQRKTLIDLGGEVTTNERTTGSELAQELSRLGAAVAARNALVRAAAEAEDALAKATQKLGDLDVERAGVREEIAELRRKLADAQKREEALDARIRRGNEEVLPVLTEQLRAAQEALAAVPDPTERMAEIQRSLAQSEERQKNIVKREHIAEQIDRLTAELGKAREEQERRHNQLEGLRKLRQHLLDGVDLGVPNLSIGDGSLLVNGVPFKKASTSEKLRVAMAVGMLQRPHVRIIRVDDGERLDAEHRNELLRIADQHGMQVFMTVVSDRKALAVQFVDRDADHAPAAPSPTASTQRTEQQESLEV